MKVSRMIQTLPGTSSMSRRKQSRKPTEDGWQLMKAENFDGDGTRIWVPGFSNPSGTPK